MYKFVVTNRVLRCPNRFAAAQKPIAPARTRKEPVVLGRRFAAVDANAHLFARRAVSQPCQKLPTVIKSLSVCPRGTVAASDGLIWPRVGCASITFPQWRSVDFLPLRWHAFLARQESLRPAILR